MTETANKAALRLRVPLGHDIPLLNAMMHVIIEENLHRADLMRAIRRNSQQVSKKNRQDT